CAINSSTVIVLHAPRPNLYPYTTLFRSYAEFNTLQSKIQKLESQLTTARLNNLEIEDLREEHTRLQRDVEEHRNKSTRLSIENQHLQSALAETEDKLREANIQRQQLQKRVSYLE